jgi:hypothetical protein
MLAAMTSLALLTRAAEPAVPAFNADFYVTVATVIPVLFLAIAFQSRTYENLLKALATPADSIPSTVSILAQTAAYVILLAAAFGEALALYTLYIGREPGGHVRLLVLIAALLLVLATVIEPAAAYAKASTAFLRSELSKPDGTDKTDPS